MVVNYIEQLFPGENFNSVEQNPLMSTIRLSKNIMMLSEKLPQAAYDLIKELFL